MPSPSPSNPPRDADRPVFVVGYEGGFVTPVTNVSRLPLVVVYGDGRVVVQGPQIQIWPSPLMPNLQEQTLSTAALDRLIDLARDKGLLEDAHYDLPGVTDLPDTVLTINLDGRTYRVSAYGLMEGGDVETGVEIDRETREGRKTLREFIDALINVPASDFVDEAYAFDARTLRLYVTASAGAGDPELEQPVIDWPLADLGTAGEQVGDASLGIRCVEVTGDELGEVLPVLQRANVLTPFRSGGELSNLVVRPQLPHESGC